MCCERRSNSDKMIWRCHDLFSSHQSGQERNIPVKPFSIICLAIFLAACSGDPHDTKVPTDITKWSNSVKPSLQKLTPEEKALFSRYAIRHMNGALPGTIGSKSDPIPEDLTIGKAIAEERADEAREQTKQPDARAAADKTGK
jgi:hypothetical protein